METLIVKVDNKKNRTFLKKLLHKFGFVIEVKTKPSIKSTNPTHTINVAGKLHQYANPDRMNQESSAWQKVAKEKHDTH